MPSKRDQIADDILKFMRNDENYEDGFVPEHGKSYQYPDVGNIKKFVDVLIPKINGLFFKKRKEARIQRTARVILKLSVSTRHIYQGLCLDEEVNIEGQNISLDFECKECQKIAQLTGYKMQHQDNQGNIFIKTVNDIKNEYPR